MNAPARRPPRGFPGVASGLRAGLIGLLSVASLARAAAAAGVGLCIGTALGPNAPSPGRILPSIALLVLATLGLRLLEAALAEQLAQSFAAQVRLRMVDAIGWIDRTSPGDGGACLSRMISDLNALRNWVSHGFAQMLSGTIGIAALLLIVAKVDSVTFRVCAGCVTAVLALGLGLTPVLRSNLRTLRRIRGRISRRLAVIVLDPQTSQRDARIGPLQRRIVPIATRNAVLNAGLRRGPEFLHGVILLILAAISSGWLGGQAAGHHPLTTLVFLGLVTAALRDLTQAWSQRLAFLESRRRIRKVLNRARDNFRGDPPRGSSDQPGRLVPETAAGGCA